MIVIPAASDLHGEQWFTVDLHAWNVGNTWGAGVSPEISRNQ